MDALLDTADFKDVPKQISDYYACMFLNYYYQLASYYSSDLDTIAQAQGYTDANAMLGASDTVITHLAKQDLLYQAIAESQGIEPTQEQLDAAAASYSGSSYGDNFVHQTALQTADDGVAENQRRGLLSTFPANRKSPVPCLAEPGLFSGPWCILWEQLYSGAPHRRRNQTPAKPR